MILVYALFNLFIFFLLPIFPRIIGILFLINESQSQHITYITTEYFVDREKYFYPILIHMDAAVSIAIIAFIATSTLFVGCCKHACAMFKIAR